MLLRLTDGTTTLTLSGAGAYLGATYFPSGGGADGRVTESFHIVLEGTEAAIRAAVNAVQAMFAQARGRERSLTARVFVEYRPTDSGDILRSEIFDGDAPYSQVPAERMLTAALNTVRVVVAWERADEWEGPETELPMASSVHAERTGGVTVTGSAGINYATMTAANVKGTRPAPIRLRVLNASGSTLSWRTIHAGLNVYSAPTSADLWLLGSEATGGGSASWSAGVNHNSLTWLIPFTTTLLGQTQGRTFRILAAFDSITSTANVRASVGSYVGGVYVPTRYGSERTTLRELIDLGEFAVPPGGYSVANAAAAMAITVRSAYSGSAVLNFVMLMPTDGYRRIEQVGFTTANGAGVEDDGIEGGAYAVSGSSRYPIVATTGDGVRVHPGRDQRLYVLYGEDGPWVAGRTMTVQAWYRPIYDNI